MMNRGFSLVESLIAMMILAIALLAMALVPMATTKLLASTVQKERASLMALNLIETMEGVPFDSLPTISTDSPEGFTRTVTIDKGTLSADVEVEVSWQGLSGRRSVTYRRQVSRYGAPSS